MEAGIPALDALLVWGGAITLLAALGTAAWRAVRGTLRVGRKVEEFINDWNGEPARPGVPARLGVMQRVSGIEGRVASIEHELHPEGGTSLRDAVDLANTRLARRSATRVGRSTSRRRPSDEPPALHGSGGGRFLIHDDPKGHAICVGALP
ncbi:hypothetical protein [Kitasatospora indigofera]|uniref:hypothetical protein n=1 Tax=Kitasatospora indigofera TaxID=67307 RepID=UPI0033BCA72A